MKKHISLLLAAVIGLSSVSFLVPETMAAENVLHITSAEEFIEFSEKCSFDGYSEGLIVELDEDMDLAAIGGKVYIPCFAGTFNGNGHTIKSVDLGNTDSSLAFIRYTTEKASIKDLNIIGSLDTDTLVAGGIVGTNLGTIENCTYEGTIKNKEEAGGIAGKNKGLILPSRTEHPNRKKSISGSLALHLHISVGRCQGRVSRDRRIENVHRGIGTAGLSSFKACFVVHIIDIRKKSGHISSRKRF